MTDYNKDYQDHKDIEGVPFEHTSVFNIKDVVIMC